MPQFNDERNRRLAASGFSSTYNWLVVATSAQPEDARSLNDLWHTFFEQRGFTSGGLNDRMFDYLGSEGFTTGALTDRLFDFWSSTAPMPPAVP